MGSNSDGDAPETLEFLFSRNANVHLKTVVGIGAARYASRNCTIVIRMLPEAGAPVSPRDLEHGVITMASIDPT